MDRSAVIFGNEISAKDRRSAEKKKRSYIKKFGDDSAVSYGYQIADCPVITEYFGARNIAEGQGGQLGPNPLIVGNIRMGFGHYRIAMAIASAAASMGYTPYWFDLLAFPTSTCTKIVAHQNELYSLGSRLSQRFHLFDRLVWEPMNSEGFRKLTYNSADQKAAELMASILKGLPKDVPFVSTHAWCAQAALHAGMTQVVSAICDNWPMALHLAEGSVHTVQTRSAFMGYKVLRGMDKTRQLKGMPSGDLVYTGHYIDHELVQAIPHDTARRLENARRSAAPCYLLTIGGAGAQASLFSAVIRHILPKIETGRASLLLNFGDHRDVYEQMKKEIPELGRRAEECFDDFASVQHFVQIHLDRPAEGLTVFGSQNIFEAVYTTNLLMRVCDVLLTKPSELAFYPVPKLMLHRVGGHEAYGALHASEVGDGTYECETTEETCAMLDAFEADGDLLISMNESILKNNEIGLYSGAYRVVELAVRNR